MTGNTRKIAEAIAKTVGTEAEEVSLDKATEEIDLLFLGDGVYGSKASKKMRLFVDQMDAKKIRNIAIFGTYGGLVEVIEKRVSDLHDRGFNVVSDALTSKGRAWLVLNRHHPNQEELENAKQYAKRVLKEIYHSQ
jgi:flavodoxin